jgi:hypothetical protein
MASMPPSESSWLTLQQLRTMPSQVTSPISWTLSLIDLLQRAHRLKGCQFVLIFRRDRRLTRFRFGRRSTHASYFPRARVVIRTILNPLLKMPSKHRDSQTHLLHCAVNDSSPSTPLG